MSEPVAWRIRIGDSDLWGYVETEWQADFYGKQRELPYVKEPLYASSPAQARALAIQECARIGRDLYRGDGSRLSSCDEGYNEAVAEYRDAIRALSPAPSVSEEWVRERVDETFGKNNAFRVEDAVRATLAALGVEVTK